MQSTKKQALLKSQRKEVAKLLDEGKEVTARALTEQLIRDEKAIEAHAQLDIFCEQLLARLDAVSRESAMPKDLIVCLCSLVFASARVDVEELKKVAFNLELRYGTLWADSCHSNLHGQVHPNIFGNLGIGRSPPAVVDEKMLTIAKEHEIDWSPLVPTPTEQDLSDTYRAAHSLHGSHTNAPHLVHPSPKPSAPPSNDFLSQHHALGPGIPIYGSHHDPFHQKGSQHTPHGHSGGSNPGFKMEHSFRDSSGSSSPPIVYGSVGGVANSDADEEMIMIEMLPDVPSNLAVSMDLAPVAIEGGVIVTHEHEEDEIPNGFADLSINTQEGTEEDLYDEILTWEDIPDGPCLSSPTSSHSSARQSLSPKEPRPAQSKAPEEEQEDPLLARFNRLKGN